MAAVSDADTALLGLLLEQPMHAWQIDKEVQWRDMRSWTDLSQSTIYRQLRSLQAAGLVTVRSEEAEGRLRKVYSLTGDGVASLRDRLCGLLSEPEHSKWKVDLGTYNLDVLTAGEAVDCLARYRAKLEEAAAGYRDLEAFLIESGCPRHRLAVARRPVRLIEAEILWLDEYVIELQTAADPRAESD